jgi:hypothetical protein
MEYGMEIVKENAFFLLSSFFSLYFFQKDETKLELPSNFFEDNFFCILISSFCLLFGFFTLLILVVEWMSNAQIHKYGNRNIEIENRIENRMTNGKDEKRKKLKKKFIVRNL